MISQQQQRAVRRAFLRGMWYARHTLPESDVAAAAAAKARRHFALSDQNASKSKVDNIKLASNPTPVHHDDIKPIQSNLAIARRSMATLPLKDRCAVLLEAIFADEDQASALKSGILLLSALCLLSHRLPNHQRLGMAAQMAEENQKLETLPHRDLH